MNELINQILAIVSIIPNYVWIAVTILIGIVIIIGIVILISLVKFIKNLKGIRIINFIKKKIKVHQS